jgi:hypothetical protein
MTIDSCFSAFNFIINFIKKEYSDKEILSKMEDLYKIDILNRYIFYIFLEIIYLIFCGFLWNYPIKIIYYFLLTMICPIILNYLYLKYFDFMIKLIENEKKKFIKIIICKQFAIAINIISEICIELNPKMKYYELVFMFEDYEKTKNNFINLLKRFLMISFIHYTKKSNYKIYGKLLAYFYNIRTGELIESIDLETAKKKFRNVIINRKWERLLNTDILQSIIYIYSLQENNDINYIELCVTKFNYMLIKMFTIWTLGEFFKNSYLIPILSIFFILYKKSMKDIINKKLIYNYIFRIIALILGYFYKNYFLISFICEFGYLIIFNKLMNGIFFYLYKKSKKFIKIFIHFNEYNIYLISIILYIKILKILINYCYILIIPEYILLNYFFIIININDLYKRISITILLIFGLISNYNDLHNLFMILIIYLIFNIKKYYNNNKNVSIDIKINDMSPVIIDSYHGYNDNNNNIKIDNFMKPSKPIIYDEGKNDQKVTIHYENIGIIENY